MNLQNRLKRLENVLIDSSPFCGCNGRDRLEISKITINYNPYESGAYVPYQHSETAERLQKEFEAKPAAAVEICETCRKPVNRKTLVLVGVNSTLSKP